jgi:hypothetical protein
VSLSPEQRRLRAHVAALTRWAHEDPRPALEHARAGFRRRFEDEVDPDRSLTDAERGIRTDRLIRAHMSSLALKSSRARSKNAGIRARRTATENRQEDPMSTKTQPKGFVYEIEPIDDWHGWGHIVEATADDLALVEHAEQQIRARSGFDGLRAGEVPHVAILPRSSTEEPLLVVALKQENDGLTYIWSPVRLPYLEQDSNSFWHGGER